MAQFNAIRNSHMHNDKNELIAWLRLSLEPDIKPSKIRLLLSIFGLPQNIYQASVGSLAAYIDPALAAAMRQAPTPAIQAIIDKTIKWLDGDNNYILSLADENYPKALLDLKDPPIIIYAQGQLDTLKQNMLAIVGARSSTPQGNENAHAFALYLAQRNWCIVSGLASGIDTHAHLGALQAKHSISTLAILGTGIDVIYPSSNKKLAQSISKNGLIISEFPMGTPAIPTNFPRRNRLVAALSKGIIIVEAATRSGSLITARLAGELGREVYAIPGSIHSPLSRGCHKLIKQGAKLVESGQDIIEELGQNQLDLFKNSNPKTKGPGLTNTTTNDNQTIPNETQASNKLSDKQNALLKALGYEYSDIDMLLARTNWPINQLMEQLTLLELEGLISRTTNGQYIRNH